jgi:hypothetical protein
MKMIGTVALTTLLVTAAACRHEDTAGPATTVAASAPATQDAEPESKTPAIDACAVLTREELEPVFGPLKDAPAHDTGLSNEKLCKYSNTTGSWLQTSLYGSDRWNLQKGTYSEMNPKALSSLGDEAFSVKRGSDSIVFVHKAGGVVEISCSCDLSKAEALAAKAVTKI